jgi:hypothetical protein
MHERVHVWGRYMWESASLSSSLRLSALLRTMTTYMELRDEAAPARG